MTENEQEKAPLKDTRVGVGVIFASVCLFGKAVDTVFKGKEKTKEARKQGYDV